MYVKRFLYERRALPKLSDPFLNIHNLIPSEPTKILLILIPLITSVQIPLWAYLDLKSHSNPFPSIPNPLTLYRRTARLKQ